MKRSTINAAMRWAEKLLSDNNIRLPEYAYRSIAEWKEAGEDLSVLKKVMLGWDITDFGMNDFDAVGAVLYTVRNGLADNAAVGVPYCEKYILMREGQRLPNHYHVYKTEDIINRAGGILRVYLWNTDTAGKQLSTDVHVFTDGIEKVFRAGEPIDILPGNSISLTPHMAHVFGPKTGCGDLIVGEVSRVNDDNTDNYFLEDVRRFAEIEEDEEALHPLCGEYGRFIR